VVALEEGRRGAQTRLAQVEAGGRHWKLPPANTKLQRPRPTTIISIGQLSVSHLHAIRDTLLALEFPFSRRVPLSNQMEVCHLWLVNAALPRETSLGDGGPCLLENDISASKASFSTLL
jgi:hypothetical protein